MSSLPPNLSGLGNEIKEYQRSNASIVKTLIISLICLMISALIFSGALGENRAWDQRIVLTILALVILLPAVFGFYMLITRRGSSVTLYENGLVYRRGGKIFATTWDDIASLTESTASRIEKKNGEAFDLGQNVVGYPELAFKLREETLNRLLPKMKESIARGGSLTFKGLQAQGKVPMGGPLPDELVGGSSFWIDANGINFEKDGTMIAWPAVVDFGIRQGEARRSRFQFFFIEDSQRCFQMNYGALPNAHLLLALCVALTPHLAREEMES